MIWIENQEFENQDIKLDFSRWRKCTFKKCNILVKHGEFDVVDCKFHDCKLTMYGNAVAVMQIAKLFYPNIPLIEPPANK